MYDDAGRAETVRRIGGDEMPRTKLRVRVIVPARSDAHLIGRTEEALAALVGIDRVAFEVVVPANNSVGSTASENG